VVHKRGLHIDTALARFQNRFLHQEAVFLCQRKHDKADVYTINVVVHIGIHLLFLICLVGVFHFESSNVALQEVQVRERKLAIASNVTRNMLFALGIRVRQLSAYNFAS